MGSTHPTTVSSPIVSSPLTKVSSLGNTDLPFPTCRRLPCHLDSQGATVFKDGDSHWRQLEVENAHVTGGGIKYPIKNAINCIDDMKVKASILCNQEDNSCTPDALVQFAQFMAAKYPEYDENDENEPCFGSLEYAQTTFVNSLMGAEIANKMGFMKMTLNDAGAWNRQFQSEGIVLSYSSSKVELIHPDLTESQDPLETGYDLDNCDQEGFAYSLTEECILSTLQALKAANDDDGNKKDYCNPSSNLVVVASAGVRNNMLTFLEGTETILKAFTDVFECETGPLAKTIEILSGEKESLFGMKQMEEGDNGITIDANTGYLDFGGSSIQPSFFFDNDNEIHPTINYINKQPEDKKQLNSFLNYGADAVKLRIETLYSTYADYSKVCELGHAQLNFDKCRELLKFIGTGGDLISMESNTDDEEQYLWNSKSNLR